MVFDLANGGNLVPSLHTIAKVFDHSQGQGFARFKPSGCIKNQNHHPFH